MCRNQMLELAIVQAAQQIGGRAVIEMAETPCDALTQFLRIAACAQQFRVVIAFQDQCIATAQYGLDVPGGATDVREYAQPARAIAEYVLSRLPRIVWHRKRLHVQVANSESLVILDHADLGNAGEQGLETRESSGSKPDRNTVAARKPGHAANMIVVLMRHDDAGEVLGVESKAGKPGYCGGEAEAAIEQQPRAAGLHHKRIALAAAAKRRKPHSVARHRSY